MLNRRQFLRTSLMTAAGALLAGVVGRFGAGEAKAIPEPVAPAVPPLTMGETFPKVTWTAQTT